MLTAITPMPLPPHHSRRTGTAWRYVQSASAAASGAVSVTTPAIPSPHERCLYNVILYIYMSYIYIPRYILLLYTSCKFCICFVEWQVMQNFLKNDCNLISSIHHQSLISLHVESPRVASTSDMPPSAISTAANPRPPPPPPARFRRCWEAPAPPSHSESWLSV